MPGAAVSVSPTFAVPDTDGVPADNVPGATAAVSPETTVAAAYPVFVPVTATESFFPTMPAVTARDDDVAPPIAAPSARHW